MTKRVGRRRHSRRGRSGPDPSYDAPAIVFSDAMPLRQSPVVDSQEMAAARRPELDIPRERARLLGLSALAAIREGAYVADDGRRVDWRHDVEKAGSSKVSLPPDAPVPAPPQ